jgi:hypothetical protein
LDELIAEHPEVVRDLVRGIAIWSIGIAAE